MFRPREVCGTNRLESHSQFLNGGVEMIRWSPGTELANLHGSMDRLFDDFFGSPPTGNGGQRAGGMPTYALPLDIREVDNGYEIQAPVPGFKPEQVEVMFSDGVLTIRAQRSEESTQRHGDYLRKEVATGNYHRSIQLPGDIKQDDIAATFEDGLLTIHAPKAARPRPQRISVSRGTKKEVSGKTS